METKFTPGPWEVDGFDLTSVIHNERPGEPFPAWKHIVKCDYGYTKPEENIEENKANAALIAAAPEMFSFIKDNIDCLSWKDADKASALLLKATTITL